MKYFFVCEVKVRDKAPLTVTMNNENPESPKIDPRIVPDVLAAAVAKGYETTTCRPWHSWPANRPLMALLENRARAIAVTKYGKLANNADTEVDIAIVQMPS